jgi:O-antigen/teichoic acid export membrane protein
LTIHPQEREPAGGLAPADPQAVIDAPIRDIVDSPAAGPTVIRGSILRISGYVAGTLMSVVSASLLLRHLSFTGYGQYVVVISLVTIVQGVTDVGLGQIGVREFAVRRGEERERLLRNLLGVRIVLTSVGVAVAIGFAAVAGYGSALVFGTLLAGLGMVLTVIQGTFAVPLAAQLQLGWVTAMDLLRQVLTVAATVSLVMVGAKVLGFLAVTVPVSIAVLVATISLVRRAIPLRPAFERAEWLVLIRAVLPFAAAVAIGTLYLRSTIILMPLLTNKHQTGYYSTSYSVLASLLAVPALTVGAALPILARAARDDAERLRYVLERLFQVMLIVGVGLALAMALGAGFAVRILSGGSSPAVVAVMQIQSIALITQFVSTAWQYGLLALHVYRPMFWISAGALALNLALTLILVPLLAARGAAIAFSIVELAGAAGTLYVLLRTRRDLRPSLGLPGRVLCAGALGAATVFLPGVTSLERCAIAGAIYLGALLALRAIPPEMLQAVAQRPRRGAASA